MTRRPRSRSGTQKINSYLQQKRTMKASIEISMYPLDKGYVKQILGFIEGLNQRTDVEVRTNTMSTQIFGEYDIQ